MLLVLPQRLCKVHRVSLQGKCWCCEIGHKLLSVVLTRTFHCQTVEQSEWTSSWQVKHGEKAWTLYSNQQATHPMQYPRHYFKETSTYLSRCMTKSITQWHCFTTRMVCGQLTDDDVQNSSLLAGMQSYTACVVHDLHCMTSLQSRGVVSVQGRNHAVLNVVDSI